MGSKMKNKKKYKKNKKKYIFIFILVIIVLVMGLLILHEKNTKQTILKQQQEQEKLLVEIKKHYNNYVKTLNSVDIYKKTAGKYVVSGKLGTNVELELVEFTPDINTKYFQIKNFNEEYYIKYNDVEPIIKLTMYSDRYKKYIPFNENIKTKEITNFYNDKELVYSLNTSLDFPIIIKDIPILA